MTTPREGASDVRIAISCPSLERSLIPALNIEYKVAEKALDIFEDSV